MTLKWNGKVRVLAADDSATMRGVYRALFEMGGVRSGRLPEMELCGLARDGVECVEMVDRLRPDVLVLDIEMPKMHGLEVLARLRVQAPTLPVIMCSAYTECGARLTLDGLARGAADYVTKAAMQVDAATAMESLRTELLGKIAALAATAALGTAWSGRPLGSARQLPGEFRLGGQVEVIAIGVSTGGPSALEKMLPKLPKGFPVPILIVQHMPKLFTSALAERLDLCCALRVREGVDGAAIEPGTVWIAPGDAHMEVEGYGRDNVIRLKGGEPLNCYKPAVDYLFASAAARYGAGSLALVMTGMGSDGLAGSRAIHDAGGLVLVQDELTSAVWGMPGRVAEAGIAAGVLPLESIAADLQRRVSRANGLKELNIQGTRALAAGLEVRDGLFRPGL